MALKARVCAICGRAGGTLAFTLPLRWLGIPGNYAHPACLDKAKRGTQLIRQDLIEQAADSIGGNVERISRGACRGLPRLASLKANIVYQADVLGLTEEEADVLCVKVGLPAKRRRRNPGRKWPQQPKTLTIWERAALKRIARYGSTGADDDALLAVFRRMPLATQRRLCPDAAPPRECSAGFTPITGDDRLVRCDYCTRLVRRTGQAGHKQKCGGWRAQY